MPHRRREPSGWQAGLIGVGLVLALGGLAACSPASQFLTGRVRPPLAATQVTVYSTPPQIFDEIAVVAASHRSVLADRDGVIADRVVERLKAAAARLGANGLIVDAVEQTQTLSLGGVAGTDSVSAHGTVSLAVGGFLPIFKTRGTGRAIYVPGS